MCLLKFNKHIMFSSANIGHFLSTWLKELNRTIENDAIGCCCSCYSLLLLTEYTSCGSVGEMKHSLHCMENDSERISELSQTTISIIPAMDGAITRIEHFCSICCASLRFAFFYSNYMMMMIFYL